MYATSFHLGKLNYGYRYIVFIACFIEVMSIQSTPSLASTCGNILILLKTPER